MKTLVRTADGESAVWWSWQDLRGAWDEDRESRRKKQQGLCTEGRAWLYVPGNNFQVSWHLGSRSCAFELTFSSIGDDDFCFYIAIPFLFAFWFMIGNLPIVKKLPGVKWNGEWGSGERKIGVAIHHETFWIYPWIDDDGRWWSLNFPDFFFGRAKYSTVDLEQDTTVVPLPEGDYPAKYRLYRATWKRPRWPWAKTLLRGEIEVEKGIPIPGKGENSWDMDDDAIFSMTCVAATKEETVAAYVDSVMRTRGKYGWP